MGAGLGKQSFLKTEFQLMHIEWMMKLENYHLAHATVYNCGRAESTKDAKIRGWPRVEKQDICIVSRYLPTAILSVTKRNTVTLQRRNLGANALTHNRKLPAPGARRKDVPGLRGMDRHCCAVLLPNTHARTLIRGQRQRNPHWEAVYRITGKDFQSVKSWKTTKSWGPVPD